MNQQENKFDYLTDSHCHLDDERFARDLDEVLKRAWDEGVRRIIAVNTLEGIEGAQRVLELADRYDWIHPVVGLHPHEAKMGSDDLLGQLEELARRPKVVAVGEMGLDFHYDHSPREKQRQVFRDQLRMARRVEKPVVIHSREADGETLAILDEENAWELGGVVHCFSGGPDMAQEVLAKGFYISFTGVITFPKAQGLRSILASLPTGRVLLETDAPYLAPVPRRGRRNEPAYVKHTAAEYARIRKLTHEDVARITSLNAARLFGLDAELDPGIAYMIRRSLYLNITNSCTLKCTFCPKRKDWMVKGHYLKLRGEPAIEAIEKAILAYDPASLDEVVFCGFGEPTLRLDAVVHVASWLKERGVRRIRLDTDGLGNLVHGRNIMEELKGKIDAVCVSLNAPDAETYLSICPNKHGPASYEAVKSFILAAKDAIGDVTATVVGMPGMDTEKSRRVAEDELGVSFRVREYNEVG